MPSKFILGAAVKPRRHGRPPPVSGIRTLSDGLWPHPMDVEDVVQELSSKVVDGRREGVTTWVTHIE